MKITFLGNKVSYPIFLLSLLFIVSCTNNDDPITPINDDYLSIPDHHFETKLIEQGIDSDGIVNKKILKTDAEKINHLNFNLSANFGEISDLTGIEGFVNLTFLSAVGQKIQDIDLSSNIKLDTLFLSGNAFTSIDISHNPNLIYLDIESNELTNIYGLSRATSLKKLNLSWNNFEEINIQNQSIEVLLMSHNLLKSINTDGALNLKNIFLIINELTSVDFSSNTLLETVVVSGNKLPNINLEHNSNLTHLYVSSNSLTSLDVSNNQELIDLRVDRNPDLTCIKIQNSQNIPTVSISDYQELNMICN